jgi:hypothetical protein
VGIYSDSSSARSISAGLNEPACRPEFHTAKSRKWENWSQRVYFTKNWKAHYAFCEGITNDFADWLSHIGHLLKEAGKSKATVPKSVNIASVADSSAAARIQYPVPPGWTLKDSAAPFTGEQYDEISTATSLDSESTFHKVPLSDLFKVMVDDSTGSVSKLERERVMAWKSKLFAIVPEGGTRPCLFVPKTFSRSVRNLFDVSGWEDLLDPADADSDPDLYQLVLVVPDGLRGVLISQIIPLDSDSEPATLRQDILNQFHEFDAHRTPSQMLEAITMFAWWPSIRTDCNSHVKYCSLCMSKKKARRGSGMGTVIRGRHRHIMFDHAILPKWLADLLGYAACLVILDLGSGEVEIIPVVSTGAIETAAAILNGWCRTRGFFLTASSDQGVAFIAQVLAVFFKQIGLKVHRLSAVKDSRAAANVEAKNKLVRELQDELSENGCVTDMDGFNAILTTYLMKHNLVRQTGGSTVFERLRGEPAIGLADLLVTEANIDADIEALSADQAAFITSVAKVTRDLMAEYKTEQMVRTRDNAYTRDTNEAHKRVHVQDFTIGQILSLHGKKVEVLNLDGFDGLNHAVAQIKELATGKVNDVRCEDLRECCYGRPQWSPIKAWNLQIGDFVVFQGPQGPDDHRAAVVTDTSNDEIQGHEYAANDKRSRWLPVWIKSGCNDQGARKCPKGFKAHLMIVGPRDITLKGKIQGEVLSDDTKRRALAAGYDWILPKTAAQMA